MLKNKCVVLGVTGSIAAYKIANLASALKKLHCDVQVIMTQNATQFITPVTFETLTGTVTKIAANTEVLTGNMIVRDVTIQVSNPGGITTTQSASAEVNGVGSSSGEAHRTACAQLQPVSKFARASAAWPVIAEPPAA